MNWRKLIIVFGSLMILTILIRIHFHYGTKNDINESLLFKVDSIYISPAMRGYLYDSDDSIFPLASYTFYQPEKIKEGDVIKKDSGNMSLFILRLDSNGVYTLQGIINP